MTGKEFHRYMIEAVDAGTLPAPDDLTDPLDRFSQLSAAIQAAENAYAPYSKFKVGCSLLTAEGGLYRGCNIENVMFNGMSHAELSAIVGAIVEEGPQMMIAEMTVWTPTDEPTPCCGACRQLIREHALNLGVKIHSYCSDPKLVTSMTLEQLLPKSFGPENLS